MRHVDHEDGAHFLRHISERLPVDGARVRTVAGDDHLRLVRTRLRPHLLVVDDAVFGHAVRHRVVEQTGEVHRRAVREVTALRQIHAEERVAGLEEGEEHRGIRRRTAVRLHVGVIGPEQLLESVDRQLLDLIHDVASAVVALARQSFGVLVGERRAHRFHDRRRHEILAGDELQPVALALRFLVDQMRDLRIRLRQGIPRR